MEKKRSPALFRTVVYLRALRLPFITASVLPFIAGSLIAKSFFRFSAFALGLVTVTAFHLGANLLNDYADSKSGVDWQDRKFYKFFGGSKLIQEGILNEAFYFRTAVFSFVVASFCVLFLAALSGNPSAIYFYFIILLLGVSYSLKPLQFSYRRLGEVIIFILFGPVPVMGGYFLQTGIFPDLKSFFISLPFGFLTTAILFSNEVPDYSQDSQSRKFNWISFTGPKRAYLLYLFLEVSGLFFIAVNIKLGYLSGISWLSFSGLFLILRAAYILKRYYSEKKQLLESSKLTIAVQVLVSIVLIVDILL